MTADERARAADETQLATRRLTSFAVMTVDWSTSHRSYLDNFLNYLLASFPAHSSTATPRDDLHGYIKAKFGLGLPSPVVQQLLRRAVKLNLVGESRDAGVYLTEKGRHEATSITARLAALDLEQAELARKFCEWAKKSLQIELDSKAASESLLDYVETYYCSLLSSIDGDGSAKMRLPNTEPTPQQRLAAAFVATQSEQDIETFESLANLARGSMMVNALYSASAVDLTARFRQTTLYLDTKIVLRALGYESPTAEESAAEMFAMLKKQGARLAVFDFTLDEIRSVIESVASKARAGRIWSARPGTVEAYFYENNSPASLIEQHSVRLDSRLAGLGIEVEPKPGFDEHRFVIDESSVEKALLTGNPFYRPSALRHDVALISAIVRLRRGRARGNLEESRATFVTLNSLVVTAAKHVERQFNEGWPIAMFENDIAALTWVKTPLEAPNLPKHQLLATSLGLVNPSKQTWNLYITEIERLLGSAVISEDDLVLLRRKYEMDRLAFVTAPKRESERESGVQIRRSIDEARESIRKELAEPLNIERERLARMLSESDAAHNARRLETNTLLKALLRPIWKRGTAIDWLIRLGVFAVALSAIYATLSPELAALAGESALGNVLLLVARIIAAAIALTGGIAALFGKVGKAARQSYLSRALRKLEVEPDRAAELGFMFTSTTDAPREARSI